jgi:PPP family 3-phenylpropionic acid transporter
MVDRKFNDLARFILLFATLYLSFGVASPFFPAFLSARGIPSEQIGLILSCGTLIRVASGFAGGVLADRSHARSKILAFFIFCSAGLACAFVPAHGFLLLCSISLLHAASLAPTTMLADTIALQSAHENGGASPRFEYGWIRGTGSAAFIVGSLLSGQAIEIFGLTAAIGGQALFLTCAGCSAWFIPENRNHGATRIPALSCRAGVISTLILNRPLLYLVLVAGIILGSHAMHDSFAMIAWNAAGISAAAGSVLWSISVAAEVLVFFLIGPTLLRLVTPQLAMAISAFAAVVRWCVLAQTNNVLALALAESLHGVTFGLLHLACMRLIVRITPPELAATAQAVYGISIATVSAALTFASGYLYARLGSRGFFLMAALAITSLIPIWVLSRSVELSDQQ